MFDPLSQASLDVNTIQAKLEALLLAGKERGYRLTKVTLLKGVLENGRYHKDMPFVSGWYPKKGIPALSLCTGDHFVTYGGTRIQGYIGLIKESVHSNTPKLLFAQVPSTLAWIGSLLR